MLSVSSLPTAYHVFGTDKARGENRIRRGICVASPRLESRPLTVADEAVVVLGGDAAQARDHRGVSRCRELTN